MYRVRFHGRGGQGTKTAGRILGSAFFRSGFEVQDAPRYGAEQRGAPMFAYVRAGRRPIQERGVITHPDLVVVADDTLIPIPSAGVTMGIGAETVVLISSDQPIEAWRERLLGAQAVLELGQAKPAGESIAFVGASGAAAAARLVGEISYEALDAALREELAAFGDTVVEQNAEAARAAWHAFSEHAGLVREGQDAVASIDERPDWIDLPFDPASVSAPHIHAGATSVEVRTGLWRTLRPIVDEANCHHCTWICATLCPDGAIAVDPGGAPRIDLDHCKGCMVCAAVCPHHAIETVAERDAATQGADS